MANPERHVDTLPAPTKLDNVQLLCLGLSRTGTMSMYNALKKLGYRPYHASEATAMASKGHLIMWTEAIEAKYGAKASTTPTPYTPVDFAKLLQDYDALSDVPSILFVPELMSAYPGARLVLTTHPRGVDAWLRSVRNSYFRICSWAIWDWVLMPFDEAFSRPYITFLRRVVEVWTGTPWQAARTFTPVEPRLRAFYYEHNERVRQLARDQDRELLEFDPAKGWAPLCEFLGKEVPNEPYPHINAGDHVVDLHKKRVVRQLKATFGPGIKRAAGLAGAAMVVGLAWWYYHD